jgi:hypothetical protein
MFISSTNLSYEIPEGWRHFVDGDRLVLQGPNGEELIISGAYIQGQGNQAEVKAAKERVFQAAVTSVYRGADHPDLTITTPLGRDATNPALECWTLRTKTIAGDGLFIQSILLTDVGVAIITFEAPHTKQAAETYLRFLRAIRPGGEGAKGK